MSNLTCQVFFKLATGVPATGLVLADIDLYLTRQHVTTGVDTVIWDGTQHPTEEIDNVGAYARIYTAADLDSYNYSLRGSYTGATALEADHVQGAMGKQLGIFPAGAVQFTYTVTSSVTGLPVEGVDVWVSTDAVGSNIVWRGSTDAFGVARDIHNNLPALDPGTYYFWKQKPGYTPDQFPDVEVVS